MSTVSLSRRAYFSASLQLGRDDLSPAQNAQLFGKRARWHGHDYTLDVFYAGNISLQDGMIVNLDELKPVLKNLLAPVEECSLNECKYLQGEVPTLEHLARALWQNLPPKLGVGHLKRVHLKESARRWCDIVQNEGHIEMKLTTKYEFAAAHRLHAPEMSAEDNTHLYGKCNNPRGHGHNYGLEVTIQGEPDAQSGELISQNELDRIVDEEVFSRFDHKHLNDDCPEFAEIIPTSENLAQVIFGVLQAPLQQTGCRLSKIGLHETQKNYFEVEA